ncbi:MAG: methanogenesis marker 5 protein [Methanobrevibacter sp.]|nr:methanogenesis marker 5 protein [Methanobrevibacter sp.]
MVEIAIYPPNSLILADLIERKGHTPLALQKQIRQKIKDPEIDSPPMNITEDDPIKGLKYAAIEVPSGVRGRMSIIGPLIDAAEAAIIVDGAPFGFGCIGCARTNELSTFLLRDKNIPTLEVTYPTNRDETFEMVNQINDFLDSLDELVKSDGDFKDGVPEEEKENLEVVEKELKED